MDGPFTIRRQAQSLRDIAEITHALSCITDIDSRMTPEGYTAESPLDQRLTAFRNFVILQCRESSQLRLLQTLSCKGDGTVLLLHGTGAGLISLRLPAVVRDYIVSGELVPGA